MKLVTFAGQAACGKTSVISKMASAMMKNGMHAGVVKFDCLQTNDDEAYRKMGIPSLKGLSAELCPDHFFITNIQDVERWGEKNHLDYLFTESAGLCNRCSPYIKNILAVSIVDQLSGIHSPEKIGPMLKLADIVIITKSDIVSQAEREVFTRQIHIMNPKAQVFHVNGLTGQGIEGAMHAVMGKAQESNLEEDTLRFPMPMAVCSYCLGETRIGEEFQIGNTRKMIDE